MTKETIKNILINLNEILTIEGQSNVIIGITKCISILDDSSIQEEVALFEVKSLCKSMLQPKAPLSEFHIWRDDFEERLKLNNKLDENRDKLYDFIED